MNMFSFTFDLEKKDLKEAVQLIDTLEEALEALEEDFQTFYAYNEKYQFTVSLHHGEVEAVNVEYTSTNDFNDYPIVYNLSHKQLIDKGWMNQ